MVTEMLLCCPRLQKTAVTSGWWLRCPPEMGEKLSHSGGAQLRASAFYCLQSNGWMDGRAKSININMKVNAGWSVVLVA